MLLLKLIGEKYINTINIRKPLGPSTINMNCQLVDKTNKPIAIDAVNNALSGVLNSLKPTISRRCLGITQLAKLLLITHKQAYRKTEKSSISCKAYENGFSHNS